jgi:hypothetical protein
MEGTEKLNLDKQKEITNVWNYYASCALTSLLVWDLESFKHLIFVAQSVQSWNLLEGTEKNHKEPESGLSCSGFRLDPMTS